MEESDDGVVEVDDDAAEPEDGRAPPPAPPEAPPPTVIPGFRTPLEEPGGAPAAPGAARWAVPNIWGPEAG